MLATGTEDYCLRYYGNIAAGYAAAITFILEVVAILGNLLLHFVTIIIYYCKSTVQIQYQQIKVSIAIAQQAYSQLSSRHIISTRNPSLQHLSSELNSEEF